MTKITAEQELIQELRGRLEALTALVYAMARVMPEEQLDLLPKEFFAETDLLRKTVCIDPGTEMTGGFEDQISNIKTTLLFPDPNEVA